MLEGLDKIDWAKVESCYGTDNLPKQIRALTSSERAVRKEAIGELEGQIWHQGDFFDCGKYVAPFLIELLQYESVLDKEEILALLLMLAKEHQFPGWFGEFAHPPELLLKMDLSLNKELRLETYRKVSEGTEVYLNCLKDKDPTIKTWAAFLLGCIRERAEEITSRLFEQVINEKDPDVILYILLSMGNLAVADPTYVAFYKRLLANAQNNEYKLASAVALIKTLREQTPLEAVDLILERVLTSYNFNWYYQNLKMKFFLEEVFGFPVAILRYLKGENTTYVVDKILNKPPEQTIWLFLTLIYLAFNGAKVPENHTLTHIQKRVLQFITQNDGFWKNSVPLDPMEFDQTLKIFWYKISNNWSYICLYMYGLPYEREKLQNFLERY